VSKIAYPAVFHEENGTYWVEFSGLKGCLTDGNTAEEAYEHAKEALGFYLDQEGDVYERTINKPSEVKDVVDANPGLLVMLVEYDSLEYAKKYKTKAVKKTLSIPEWLNDLAVKQNINFSNVLQEALIKKIEENSNAN